MVIDTSIILAIFFAEPDASWAADRLNEDIGNLAMSTVNLTEALILIGDRQPSLTAELQERLLTSGIQFVPPDIAQARIAADARLRYPLSLGDCFTYALAVATEQPVLTLDTDFRQLDIPVVMP